MSLKSRRILFAFFVLVFCTLVPIVLLYATGHTINWRRLSLEKTGTILIDSEPNNASIFIDGRPIDGGFLSSFNKNETASTNARLKNIAPGEHTIRLELEGYWPWEEQFRLSPDEAVNFNLINLYKQAKPELIYTTATTINAVSPNSKYLAFAEAGKINLIDTSVGTIKSIALAPETEINNLQWSADENFISAGSLLINPQDQTVTDFSKIANTSLKLLRWDVVDKSKVWAAQERTLFSYSTTTKEFNQFDLTPILKNETIIDFSIYAKQIYIISSSANKQETLYIGEIAGSLKKIELAGVHNYFVLKDSALPCLYNGHTLYVIDEPLPLYPTPRLVEALTNFNVGEWINNGILYSSALELRRWDSNEQNNLLTRFGSPILALKQLSRKPVIVVALSDSIRLFSDSRTSYILNIASIKNTTGLAVAENESYIYLLGEYEGVHGLYRLPL